MGLMDVMDNVSYVVDTPRALTHGAIANLADAVRGRKSRNSWRASGREMLESLGVLGENQDGLDMGDAVGFGAEMLLDPVNLLGGAGVLGRLGKSKAIRAANAKSMAQRAAGFMPEEIARATKIVDESGMPKRVYHGTGTAFGSYDLSKTNPDALYGPGVYLTDSPEIASDYVNKGVDEASRAAMMERNPAVRNLAERMERIGQLKGKLLRGIKKRAGLPSDAMSDEVYGVMTEAEKLKRGQAEHLYNVAKQRISDIQAKAAERALSPNIRMHYVDVRNPLDMRNPSMSGRDAADVIERSGVFSGDLASTPTPSSLGGGDEYENLAKAIDSIRQMDEFMPPSAGRGTPSEKIFALLRESGGGKRRAVEALKRAGYDGITHAGGQIVGNVPHSVTIAFDPSQVYKPYIAKSIADEPRLAPVIASLMGYNVARNVGGA